MVLLLGKQFANPQGFLGKLVLFCMKYTNRDLMKWSLHKIEWKSDYKVLDVGCGNGYTLYKLQKLCPRGFCYGIDTSVESLRVAKYVNRNNLNKSCVIEWGDIYKPLYEKNSFDVIVSLETIYFFDDIHKVLQNIYDLLVDNGYMILAYKYRNLNKHKMLKNIANKSMIDEENIKTSLKKIGFKTIDIYHKHNSSCIVAKK